MYRKLIYRAQIIIEALPYIRKFHGQTMVIKYGGAAMGDDVLKEAVCQDIMLLKYVGINPVIVHGGGPQISDWLKRIGKETKFIDGLRVTDKETMEVTEMVLAGKINKNFVYDLARVGAKAIGLSGKDGNLIMAQKARIRDQKGKLIDLGQVGEITKVNTGIINTLCQDGYIPVISSIGVGDKGESYNINADHLAGKLAAELKALKLVLLTDVTGVLKRGKLISVLNEPDVKTLIDKKVITGGMLPKAHCCLDAIKGGVSMAHIINGRIKHAILLEIFTDHGIGTMFVKAGSHASRRPD